MFSPILTFWEDMLQIWYDTSAVKNMFKEYNTLCTCDEKQKQYLLHAIADYTGQQQFLNEDSDE